MITVSVMGTVRLLNGDMSKYNGNSMAEVCDNSKCNGDSMSSESCTSVSVMETVWLVVCDNSVMETVWLVNGDIFKCNGNSMAGGL